MKRVIELSSGKSKQELLDALKATTEIVSDFNYTTTGKREELFFLGKVGTEKIHIKKNIFESQLQRRRFTLEGKGSVVSEGRGSKLELELKYFSVQSGINKMALVLYAIALTMIPFAYDSTNLLRIVLAEGAMLLILFGMIWSYRATFNRVADEMEGKLREIVL